MTVANTAADTTNTKAAPAAPKKEPKPMATATETKPVSYSDLLKQKEALLKQQAEIEALLTGKRTEEIKVLVNGWKLKAEKDGFSVQEVIEEFKHYLPKPAVKTPKAPKEPGAVKEPRVYKDLDSTGARPEEGKSYKLHDGTIYLKKAGRTGGDAIAAVKEHGKTWAEMLVKS